MKRDEAEKIAERMRLLQLAYHDKPERLTGIKLAALLLADIVSGNGVIEEVTYLRSCGIELPKDPPKPEKVKPVLVFRQAQDNAGPYGYRRRAPKATKAEVKASGE